MSGKKSTPAERGDLIFSLWKHYKNERRYRFLQYAINPNTDERIVVYMEHHPSAPDGVQYYWRPYDEFMSKFRRVLD